MSLFDIFQKIEETQTVENLKTGIVRNDFNTAHFNQWDKNHPEDPLRFIETIKRCEELDLFSSCESIEPRLASKEEILLVHSAEHYRILKEACEKFETSEQFRNLSLNYSDVYMNNETFESALFATGSVCNLVEAVIEAKVRNGMAIIRPPGHHAMHEEFNGYCFFNNVAIAAKYAMQLYRLRRILIFDFDVHHGQGTQRIFYNDKRVMYISIHRYENGKFWPFLRESHWDYCGGQGARGYNVNVPLNKIYLTDADYMFIFHNIVLPLAYEFDPQLILVSAGYDAAFGCPEGQMNVSPFAYYYMISQLKNLAGGKLCVILEGGYFRPSLAESVAYTIKALKGEPIARPQPDLCVNGEIDDSVIESTFNTIDSIESTSKWKHLRLFPASATEPSSNTYRFQLKRLRNLIYCGSGVFVPPNANDQDYFVNTAERIDESLQFLETYKESIFFALHSTIVRALFQFMNSAKNGIEIGYVYDEKLLEHFDPTGNSVEKPNRLLGIVAKLNELKLLDKCRRIQGSYASIDQLLLIHSQEYLDRLQDECTKASTTETEMLANKSQSIYLNTSSMSCASFAAGSLLTLTDAVLGDAITCGLALIRPPGHHAERDRSMGFCIFNNVAIAAKHAVQTHKLKRVAIIDFDVHWGNGIQHAFYSDPNVLYVSVHRYDCGAFYPKSGEANYTFTGAETAQGLNVNIPLDGKMTDTDYIYVFNRIILPILYEYNAELTFISCGLDACSGDPLGHSDLSPQIFGHFVSLIKNTVGARRTVVALEGGYNLNSISLSMVAVLRALLDQPSVRLNRPLREPAAAVIGAVQNVCRVHGRFWKFLSSHTFETV